MYHLFSIPLGAVLAWVTLWISAADSASDLTYCSTESTGSGAANFSIYQSNGNCQTHCSGSAFAILQGKNCWCSDIAPNDDDNVQTSNCDDGCPGFPDDSCGSASKGLYAYVQIGSPSGTASASSTSSTDSSSTSDETSTSTSHSSVVETHGGQVTTVTVGDAGSTSAADTANDSKSDDGGSGVSGGAIAGIVVGVVGGIALIVAAIILFLVKRRRAQQDAGYQNDSIDGRQSKGSGMSYAGSKGVFADNHSHTLSNGSSSAPHRMPTFTDNRLNTGALLYPNGRRASDVSLQDNEDYSRPVLRLTNPD
ncbi:hypothetical protein ASPSYDRAFT_91317 [Aspergillus sydowii CBS 593.65]|uniref:WSC domain-containing protein n=1 Tax=Aspergillus sydowii CBS 593.65 TaxID=1036612 RepID=A0A1L9TCK4_9EURO|nr:uncharacterized protein ASPSYDRAFT_91317 [Aspergillus sydowii CBS 593.65]OJJ57013.1 hypothetical protein ASPSYDRAFT_91317 [Aspergillus sydowii CBS 593.65]